MRQGPHQKRGRGRGNRRPNTPNRNQTFDSNGPDVRIRGNAHQVYEKYLNLGRDASASGDRVLAESYFQHADHYFRIVSAFAENEAERRERNAGNGAQPDVQSRDWSGEDGERQEERGDQGAEREAQGSREQVEEGDGAERGPNGGDRETGRRGRPRRQRDASRDDGPATGEAVGVESAAGVEVSTAPEAADEDGIRRTLKMSGSADTAEAGGAEPAKPRRRRRPVSSEASAETPVNDAPVNDAPVNDDDGAAAAS